MQSMHPLQLFQGAGIKKKSQQQTTKSRNELCTQPIYTYILKSNGDPNNKAFGVSTSCILKDLDFKSFLYALDFKMCRKLYGSIIFIKLYKFNNFYRTVCIYFNFTGTKPLRQSG